MDLSTAGTGENWGGVNTAYRAAELEYVLSQGDVTTLFMVEEWRGNSYIESIRQLFPELEDGANPDQEVVQSKNLPCFKRAVLLGNTPRPGCLIFSQILELAEGVSDETLQYSQGKVHPHDPAMIQYTSGTTDFPKGAVLTHHNLINNSLCYSTPPIIDLSEKN